MTDEYGLEVKWSAFSWLHQAEALITGLSTGENHPTPYCGIIVKTKAPNFVNEEYIPCYFQNFSNDHKIDI